MISIISHSFFQKIISGSAREESKSVAADCGQGGKEIPFDDPPEDASAHVFGYGFGSNDAYCLPNIIFLRKLERKTVLIHDFGTRRFRLMGENHNLV